MKKIITFISILLLNCLSGAIIGSAVGVSPLAGAIGANGIAALAGLFPSEGGLRAGVLVELWTGELVKKLRSGLEGSWLDGIPDASSAVEKDVIHLVDVGVDPDVLVNNTTYPIDTQALPDGDIAISLDKFQTKATPVTDDELYAVSYDKMARVKEAHANAINDTKFAKAAHSLCPAANTERTPVLKTTGPAEAGTGRKKLVIDDLISLKKALDKLGVPAAGRRLVLCFDHVNDLLACSESFLRQYNIDTANGVVARLFGFDIYTAGNTPVYSAAGAKKELGSAAAAGEFPCSFAFYTGRVFKATGSTKMYFSEAKSDPLNQRNLVNYRHYFICMPKKTDAMAALMSDHVAG